MGLPREVVASPSPGVTWHSELGGIGHRTVSEFFPKPINPPILTGWAPSTSSSRKSSQPRNSARLSFPGKPPAPAPSPCDLHGREGAGL